MLRSLLVGVNGTEWSYAASEIAVSWAAQFKIPLTCLGAVDIAALTRLSTTPIGAGELVTVTDPGLISLERERIQTGLRRAGELAERANVECRLICVEGHPAVQLGDEAQRHDLVVLGRPTPSDLGSRSTPSETLMEILRRTPRPVVLAARKIPNCSNVIIAYDGSVQAARTLQSFVSSGLCHGHPLHLVGISDSPVAMHQTLGKALDFLTAHCLKAETHSLPIGNGVADSLINFVEKVPAGMMVIGAYGQPWYKELLFGSVTRSVLTHLPVPLFVYH